MLSRNRDLQKLVRTLAAAALLCAVSGVARAQPLPMLLQAEAMSTDGSTAPMAVGSDFAAMGGRVLTTPSGAATSTNPVRGASARVDLPAGTYYLWVRIAGPAETNDALYVGIDTSFDRVFPVPSVPGKYEWVKVETSDKFGVRAACRV